MKVCCFNLRVPKGKDGRNFFPFRCGLIRRALSREDFDLIGFQEAIRPTSRWLRLTLRKYAFAGMPRKEGRLTEQLPVAFRRNRFRLLEERTFWLSPTPEVPGSRFPADQSRNPRRCVVAVLEECGTGRVRRVYNTHLDHKGEKARRQGMEVVLREIAADEARFPSSDFLLMGDFNAPPQSPFLKNIPVPDATASIPVTFTGYHPERGGSKIDYIYTNAPFSSPRVLTDTKGKRMLSDHYPVAVDIE